MPEFDVPADLFNLHFEIGDDLAGNLGQIDHHEVLPLRGDARKRQ